MGYEVPVSFIRIFSGLNSRVDRLTIYLDGQINDYRSRFGGITEIQVIAPNKGGKSEHQREDILRNSESPDFWRRKVSQKRYRPDLVGIRVKW